MSITVYCFLSLTNKTSQKYLNYKSTTPDCDSLKFPDFKENLTLTKIPLNTKFDREIARIAECFIKKQCQEDNLYCKEIYLKQVRIYNSINGIELFSYGYAFKNIPIEKQSASFFVFGIKNNNKIAFYDIVEDLVGEIQLQLSGFEKSKDTSIIWGEMYPYFGKNYGEFKLNIVGGKTQYDFKCHSKEN